MTKEYPHEIKREFQSISGKYILEKEERIEVDGKVVLYAVGNAIVDLSRDMSKDSRHERTNVGCGFQKWNRLLTGNPVGRLHSS
jgi:hypothetical protein